jgi:hypothetical protein
MKQSRYIGSIIALTFLWLPAVPAVGQEASAVNPKQVIQTYSQLPLSFEANQGQTDKQVRFLARGPGYGLFLTAREAVLALKKAQPRNGRSVSGSSALGGRLRKPAAPFRFFNSEPAVASPFWAGPAELGSEWSPDSATDNGRPTDAMLRIKLVGANPKSTVRGLEELPGKSNYFIGNDPKKWRTDVPNYAKVKYESVYPGVDLVYYGNQRQLEYDFVVQPGADPRQIAMQLVAPASSRSNAAQTVALHIDSNGDLVVQVEGGEVRFHKPLVYQPATHKERRTTKNDGRHLVEGQYVLCGDYRIAFQLAPYDHRRPVVIDPTLAYSTYLGGSDDEQVAAIAVDASNNAYVTGFTTSINNFPITAGAFQTRPGLAFDAFVSKLNAAGSALIYSTYLGGSGGVGLAFGFGIAVDASGSAYVTGGTTSPNFPTTVGAFQTTFGGDQDTFVSKLNAAGSALVYSTYLGGSGPDGDGLLGGIAVDASGNVYLTSSTSSSNFPTTPGSFQTTLLGNESGFVSKLNADGSALLYSTYLGGNFDNNSLGVAVDASGHAYVTGFTNSSSFPTTPGAFSDSGFAFVSKLNPTGSGLLYSTRFGGSADTVASGIAIDALGNAYVTGHTSSSDFPTTPGAFQRTCGGCNVAAFLGDAFITKFNPAASALIYSTYLGGSGDDRGSGIALDASGNAYVSGVTVSHNFPTTAGAFQTAFGGGVSDAFFSKLNAAGSALVYSTYLGGSDIDNSNGIAVDASGSAYVGGYSFSSNFPTTPGAFQTTFGGGSQDTFVSKFSFGGLPFSSFSGKLELDVDAGSFDLNASFTLGAGGSINPVTEPVSLTIGTYSVTIPARSFVEHKPGYAFEGVINGVSLEVLIKFGSTAGSYTLLAEGRGVNLNGTTNPVTVTLSIGNNTGTTKIHAGLE